MTQPEIAKNLKIQRNILGWSLSKAALKTGVSKAMLGQIERGESSPTIATLWKIATGFHLPFTAFIESQTSTNQFLQFKDGIRFKTLFSFDKKLGSEMFIHFLEPNQSQLSAAHEQGVVEDIVGYIRNKNIIKSGGNGALSLALLPFLIMPVESAYVTPTIRHAEVDSIVIDAPIEQVWLSLPNIHDIKQDELTWTFSHFIGLPKPKSSVIGTLRIGELRKSSWEKGIYFQERITQIKPNKLLAYDVLVDEQSMKIANLDTHITVGDQYFDIEKGHYRLEDLDGKTRLTIMTAYRMTTNVNWYGQLWANFVLDDFHYMVLNLIKGRNEFNADNA